MTLVEFLARHPVAVTVGSALLMVASGLVIRYAADAEADAVGVES